MFQSKKTKENSPVNIIFDIRSSSVGIAAWKCLKNKPTIVYTDRQYILFEEKQNDTQFVNTIYKTLDQIISRFLRSEARKNNSLYDIDQVSCTLSYPWYKAEIKNINFEEKKTKKFNKSYLDNKVELIFEKIDHKTEIEIDNKIMSVYLNGYEVTNPNNKEFNKIRISAFRGVMSKTTKRDLEKQIRNNLKYEDIHFHTHPYSILSVLRNNFHSLDNFSVFNVGGEVTEILNFTNGSLSDLITIPNGFNYLVRELSVTINNNKNSTFSKIKLLTESELEDEKLKSQIIVISKKWFAKLSQSKTKSRIDRNIFVTVDKDFAKIIKNILGTKSFYEETLSLNKEPNVRIINSDNTKNLAEYSQGIEKDPLLSIFFNFQQLIFNKIC